MISVVIPTLNAEACLPRALALLADGRSLIDEVVVADGGSGDATISLARAAGARVVEGPPGRGRQLAQGAAAARGKWLFFQHADSRPGPGWHDAVAAHVAGPGERAAVFRLRFDDRAPAARRLERIVAWRTRTLGLPYGDQGLLIQRRLYDVIGGFRPLVLMEDVAIARALGRRRIELLAAEMVTDAARYRDGYIARSGRNLCCLALYFAGVPPPLLKRLYG